MKTTSQTPELHPMPISTIAKKAWRLDCCKDGTISIRKKGQKSFNGAALPCYGTDTKAAAESLQIMTCSMRYSADDAPSVKPGGEYVFAWGLVDGELEQIDRISTVFAEIERNGPAAGRQLAYKLDRFVNAAA